MSFHFFIFFCSIPGLPTMVHNPGIWKLDGMASFFQLIQARKSKNWQFLCFTLCVLYCIIIIVVCTKWKNKSCLHSTLYTFPDTLTITTITFNQHESSRWDPQHVGVLWCSCKAARIWVIAVLHRSPVQMILNGSPAHQFTYPMGSRPIVSITYRANVLEVW